MSIGNFSDELQRLDISKMSIGFIPDLGPTSKEVILNHLGRTVPGFTKTRAMESIKQFGRKVERDFWDLAYSSTKKYENTGIPMHILGKGVRTVFPRLAYSVGDDPALHRYACMGEGNCIRSCIHCMYSVKRHGLYVPGQQPLRNPQQLALLVADGKAAMRKRAEDTLT